MGSVCHRYICILIYMKLCSVVVLQRSMVNWRRGVSLPWVYVHSAIHDTYFMYWCCIDVWLIRGGGICLTWVYVHSAIYETNAV